MNLAGVLSQLVSLFLMMIAGYALARIGLITREFRQRLSSFTLNTASPCVIISSVLQSESVPSDMIGAVGAAVLMFIALIFIAAAVVRIVPTPKEERGLDQLLLIFTNLGFMGIPVIQSLYGADGVALLSMFILTFNFFFFSYGVILIQPGAKISLKNIINACIVASTIALFFGLTGWHLPAVLESTIASIGSMNTPLAMMIIGSSLAFCDLKETLTNKRLYRVGLLRMVLIPLLIFVLVKLLPLDPMLAGVCIICAAMPIAGNCGVLSELYIPDDLTASHAVIVTTLMSAATLPVIFAMVTYLL
ncbi:MAG: AEC family transporter [Clostridia bacterium]|nr:AEC family transporter [Clostridia bacterium]